MKAASLLIVLVTLALLIDLGEGRWGRQRHRGRRDAEPWFTYRLDSISKRDAEPDPYGKFHQHVTVVE